MSGENRAMTGPSGRGGHFCWAGCGKTRGQSQRSAAKDGRSICGPNTPLSKAFIFCGWETISVDWMIDSSHDLSHSLRQQSLHEQLQSVCFIAAALDCSTKSRAREIPRDLGDGRPPPRPLRSEKHPLGLPELTGSQRNRVERDNAAASFVLSEIDQLVDRGGGSVRENPYNSLHWWTPDEVAMWGQLSLVRPAIFGMLLWRCQGKIAASAPQHC